MRGARREEGELAGRAGFPGAPIAPPWTWSKGFLDEVQLKVLDQVQLQCHRGHWEADMLDQVQGIKTNLVQIMARPRPLKRIVQSVDSQQAKSSASRYHHIVLLHN